VLFRSVSDNVWKLHDAMYSGDYQYMASENGNYIKVVLNDAIVEVNHNRVAVCTA